MLTNQNFTKVFFGNTRRRISNLQDLKKAELDRKTGLFLFEDMTLGKGLKISVQKCTIEAKCLVSFIYTTVKKQ